MKKLLIILPALFFTLALNAQTEDIGKGKTFGNYKGTAIIIPDFGKNAKQIDVQRIISGMVAGKCTSDCCNRKLNACTIYIDLDGKIISVGTGDKGFTVPNEIVGRKIIVEGMDNTAANIRRRRPVNSKYQKDTQFVATGIMVAD
jgi:hypothetical protein